MSLFKLEIDLEGDAMVTDQPRELARCMAKVVDQLQDPSRETGTVMDTNGNTVGTWWIEVDQ